MKECALERCYAVSKAGWLVEIRGNVVEDHRETQTGHSQALVNHAGDFVLIGLADDDVFVKHART